MNNDVVSMKIYLESLRSVKKKISVTIRFVTLVWPEKVILVVYSS